MAESKSLQLGRIAARSKWSSQSNRRHRLGLIEGSLAEPLHSIIGGVAMVEWKISQQVHPIMAEIKVL